MKLLPKILSGYVLILTVLVIVTLVLLWSLSSANAAFDKISYEKDLEENAAQLDLLVYETGYFIRGYLLTGNQDFLDDYNGRVTAFSQTVAETQVFYANDPDPQQEVRLQRIQELYTQWQDEIIAQQVALRQQVDRGVEGATMTSLGNMVADKKGNDLRIALRTETDAFKQREAEQTAEAITDAKTNLRNAGYVAIAVTAFAIIAGLFVGFYNSRSIATSVGALSVLTQGFTRGDLTQRSQLKTEDEVGELATNFNVMADRIQEMVNREVDARRALEETVADYMRFVERVAQGHLKDRLSIHSNGNSQDDPLTRLGSNLNIMVDGLADLTQRIEASAETERNARQNLQNVIDEYVHFVESVAQGDLTHRVTNKQQDVQLAGLGDNLNRMVGSLAEITAQTREVSLKIGSATAEILAATTQQLASVTEQDTSISQTSTTATEVLATVTQTAERSEMVAKMAQRSLDVTQKGQEAVRDSIEGMQVIRHKVEDIATNILALSEKTQQIGQIISSVNDIAEQSKVLALNASIEAARAGEEGKSFAVVAMEVRNLAEQSREATEQVREILNEIQQATNTAVMATEEGIKGVDGGQDLINRAGQTIQDLAGVIRESAQAASQIAASTHQQTVGMDQLSAAMNAIRQASLQTTASVQQAERSAQDLNSMAKQMHEAVARYKV